MKNAIIDFESYYGKECSVSTVGVPNYVNSSYAYLVGVLVDGEAQCGELLNDHELLNFCFNLAEDPTVRPVAANSNFDQAWWEKCFPAFKKDWYCVLDQSAFNQFPRNLAGCAMAALGETVDKSLRDEMQGKHYDDLPPAEKDAMQHYCLNDVIKEAECMDRMPPMSPTEEKVAAHTRMVNRRGVHIDRELVDQDKTRLETMRFDAFNAIPWHKDAQPLSYKALQRYCVMHSLPVPRSLAKTDDETTELMTDNAELSEVIGFMRRFRRANTLLKKVETLLIRITPDDRLPLDLLFCGAPHTRRWSSKGFNIQNLDREPIVTLGKVPGGFEWSDLLSGEQTVPGLEWIWPRNWIVPSPGHIFLILDLAQIEPRAENWLAGNNEMMDALKLGFSYYEAYAGFAKGWKGAPGTLKAEFGKLRYTRLKNEALGCGFGMGATKYRSYAATSGEVVTDEEAKRVVSEFRRTNPKIVAFWGKLDNLIKSAARDKSRHLAAVMPTGDLLQHFEIRTARGGYQSYTVKTEHSHNSLQPRLWGGTLAENVTQRMARDILAEAVLNLEAAGFPVAFHNHDEVVLDVPLDHREQTKAEAVRIFTVTPEWANGLPLAADADFAEAYTKL